MLMDWDWYGDWCPECMDWYEAGARYGYERGRADTLQALVPAAELLAASLPAHPVSIDELRRRRTESMASRKALTPAQIRAYARHSWGLR